MCDYIELLCSGCEKESREERPFPCTLTRHKPKQCFRNNSLRHIPKFFHQIEWVIHIPIFLSAGIYTPNRAVR